MKKKPHRKFLVIITAIVVISLIGLRLLLPGIVKNYVNSVLADLPGYSGAVAHVDISLWKGAYTLHQLQLKKKAVNSDVPFLEIDKTDISIQWRALLNGSIVSEIELDTPSLIYVFEHQNENDAVATDVEDWTKALTDLVPIDINRFYLTNGKLAFVQLTANPNIDLQLHTLELEILNIKNVVRTDTELPSNVKASAISIGNGKVNLNGKLDLLKKIPDFDISFSLENAEATALNDLTKHYAGIDFNEGNWSVFSEIVLSNNYLKGYIKPILKNAKLLGKEDPLFNKLWEGFVGVFKLILKNPKNNSLATNVPFEGDLSKVETNYWKAIINIVKNAWIQSFSEEVEHKLDFEAVSENPS